MKRNPIHTAVRPLGLVKPVQLAAALCAAAALLVTGCATAPPPTTQAAQSAMTPAQALAKLEAGNARFVEGKTLHRDWSAQRAKTATGQYPFAAVLSCVDSRVSSEIIFDQGFGDIFNARVAGNVLDEDLLGSMEFAGQLAGAKLIAVVGHSSCGAVKGACTGAELGNLTGLLDKIEPSVEQAKERMPGVAATDPRFIDAVAELNVHAVMRQIREQSPTLRALIDSGKVGLVGGIYNLESGKVEFFKE